MKPVTKLKHGRVKIDVLALQKSMKAGTLSEDDRATVERVLPGLCGKVGETLLALGPSGNVSKASKLIEQSRAEGALGCGAKGGSK